MNVNFVIPRKILYASAAVVVALATLFAGGSAVAAATCFTDVDSGAWYEPFVCWAADEGVVNGYDDGTFRPNDTVTRAEVATIAKNLADTAHPTIAATSGGSAYNDDSADVTWRDIPGASVTLTNPTKGALVTARFSAESSCDGGDYASIQILLDGVPFGPAVGSDFAFDSSDGATETGSSWESHAMEGLLTNVPAGSHTVKVQSNSGCTSFRIDDWTLVVTSWPMGTVPFAPSFSSSGTADDNQR